MKNNRGAVSVLLCGIFLALVVLVGAAADAASLAVANSFSKRIDYLASESVLAEYDKNLFKDYGLMAFNGGSDEIKERIEKYVGMMTGTKKINSASTVFFDIELDDLEVDCEGKNLADKEIFLEKVKEDLKYRSVEIGAAAISAMMGGKKSISSELRSARSGLSAEEKEYKEKKAAADAAIEAGEEAEPVEKRETIDLNNNKFNIDDGPSNRVLRSGRVKDALPSGADSVGSESYSSYVLGKESGLLDLGGKSSDTLESFQSAFASGGDKAALAAYITSYFGSALTVPKEGKETFFTNEIEYIIKGNLSDKNNYRSVKNQLFLLRTALNIAHIYADAEKRAVTLEAASFAGIYAPALQFIFASAWAAAEAREDIETLYTGGSVPFSKTASDWKLGFSSVYAGASSTAGAVTSAPSVKSGETASSGGRGLSYDDYLILLLMTVSRDKIIERTMDLIQTNMKGRYDIQFDLRNCILAYSEKAQFNRIARLPSVLPGIIEDNAMFVEGEYAY